jgi:HlyD family secretion protein
MRLESRNLWMVEFWNSMANNGKRRWLKRLVVLIVVAGIVAAALAYFQRQKHNGEPEYQTAAASRGEITQAVTASGTLNPVLNVQVGSQISGIIQKLFADFNSPVKAGQVVAQLDPGTYQANVNSAEGELANAKASLELAQINARRAEQLLKDKLIPQSEYDQSIATLHQAEAQVKIRTASLERAKVDFDRCTIYSPVDGIVIDRKVDVGQTVAASMSAPTLFLIANDLTKMQIDANVAEADIGGVAVGQQVDFTVDAFPLRTFTGQVVQVRNAPLTVQSVVTYDTVIEVGNPDLKLKPGMTANVSIVTARRENVLKIPNAALRFRPPEVIAAESKTNVVVVRMAEGSSSGSSRLDSDRPKSDKKRGKEGARAAGNGPAKPKPERQIIRTIYIMPTNSVVATEPAKPQPVQIKCGISDEVSTEVLEGLNEGDVVVTGVALVTSEQKPTNPFGSSYRRH